MASNDLKNHQIKTKWHTVSVSIAGTSHIKSKQPCHDAFRVKSLPHGEIIIAVADGAGSAAKPEIGSKLAVKMAIDSLTEKLSNNLPDSDNEWQVSLQTAFQQARTALEQEALTKKKALNDYATTLIVVVLTEEWTVCGLIGDCVAVILDENSQLISLCPPQKGEYANMTHFLTQHNALEQFDIQIRHHSVQGVAVLSDGLLNLALNIAQNEPYSPFFLPLFDFVATVENKQQKKQLEAFLDSERVNNRTDDDKTLVLARRITISKDILK